MARVAFVERAKAVAAALAWIALFVGVGLALSGVLGLASGFAPAGDGSGSASDPGLGLGPWRFALAQAAGVAGFAAATWLVGHRLNGRSAAALGWAEPRRLAQRLAMGVLGGGVMAAIAVGVSILVSGATLQLEPVGGYAMAAAPLGVGLLGAALAEELIFRGYPLRRLADAVGPGLATAVLAVGFGAAHLGNPNVTALGAANIALAAVWLAAAFFTTGGMPLAWGLHFGWNAGLALGFDAPVSGFDFALPHVEYGAGRLAWVDGGAFGPEGGAVGTLALAGGTVALLARRRATAEIA